MRKALIASVIILIAVVVLAVGVGYLLPVDHVATRNVVVNASPERVHAVLVDVQQHPRWRSGVEAVEVLSKAPLRWRERSGGDVITFELVEHEPAKRLVSRIADDTLPFGGTWTYELAPESQGTRVTITERGQVFNPLFRFVSRFVFGHTATIDGFLADLQRYPF